MGNILIVAGEVSGDIQAARLIRAIKGLSSRLRFWGVGGSELANEGVEIIKDITREAIVGFIDVVKKYKYLRGTFYEILSRVEEFPPTLAILVDYPGFNMMLAKELKRRGIKIVYYISPQVWAWGKDRVKKIAKLVDLMLVIFPFEEKIYKETGVNVKFVGHPIIDVVSKWDGDRETLRMWFNVGSKQLLIGLLPGSRLEEVKRHLPVMLDTGVIIKNKLPQVKFIIGCASKDIYEFVRTVDHPLSFDVGDRVTYDILNASDLVITSSGTTTVEAACFGVPMVVIYKMHWFNYLVLKRLVKVPYIAMANIIAGERIVPELIQDMATPHRIAEEALAFLEDEGRTLNVKRRLKEVKANLGEPGVCKRAAESILEMVR